VGYGVTTPLGVTFGTKKWIDGTIDSISADQVEINVTTSSQDGEYFGDSGGPLFFRMPDSSWRLIGEDCCSPAIVAGSAAPRISTYTSLPIHVAWMEQLSGIDVTPCHDSDGWNPAAACTGFSTNPEIGVGSWDTMCAGESVVRQPTCQGTISDAGTSCNGADAQPGLCDADADSEDSSPDLWSVADGARDTGVAATDSPDAGGLSPGTLDSGYDGSAGDPSRPGSFDGNSADGDSLVSGLDSEGRDDAREDGPLGGSLDSDRRHDASQPGGGNDSGAAGNDGGGSYGDGSADVTSGRPDGASRPDLHGVRGSGGCGCRSIPDRDGGFGLLLLAIVYVILRRSRRHFVV
jgi:MYXO-CTERM domain-containing protein